MDVFISSNRLFIFSSAHLQEQALYLFVALTATDIRMISVKTNTNLISERSKINYGICWTLLCFLRLSVVT